MACYLSREVNGNARYVMETNPQEMRVKFNDVSSFKFKYLKYFIYGNYLIVTSLFA